MNSLLHRDGGEDLDEQRGGGGDREIQLSTTLILGLFFALAVVCAVFFGLGYSMGRKSVVPATAPAPQSSNAFAGFKPAAGSILQPDKPVQAATQPVTVPLPPASSPDTASESVKAVKLAPGEDPADGAVVGDPLPPAPVRPSAPSVSSAAATMPAAVAGGSSIVQVAAVSHQEDADLLLTTLKRRGYAVSIRNEPQDKLLHVQVGPFATHKDADAMRQRLLADGFNAIVKDAK